MRIRHLTTVFGVLAATSSNIAAAQCWSFGDQQPPDRSATELTACHMAQVEQCQRSMPGFEERTREVLNRFTSDPRYIDIARQKDFYSYKKDAEKYLTEHPENTNCESLLRSLLSK